MSEQDRKARILLGIAAGDISGVQVILRRLRELDKVATALQAKLAALEGGRVSKKQVGQIVSTTAARQKEEKAAECQNGSVHRR